MSKKRTARRKTKLHLDIERVVLEHMDHPRVVKHHWAEQVANDVIRLVRGEIYWKGKWRKRCARPMEEYGE